MEKKAQIEGLAIVLLTIFIAGLVLIFGIIMISGVNDAVDFDVSSKQENFTVNYNDAQTLEEIPISSSATRLNQTWLDFDGVDDLVSITNNPMTTFNITNNYTFIARVRLNNSNYGSIYSKGSWSSSGLQFFAGTSGFGLRSMKDSTQIRYSAFSLNTFYDIVCVYNGVPINKTYCYTNNTKVSVAGNDFDWGNIQNSTNTPRLGAGVGDYPFNGSIGYFYLLNYSSDGIDVNNFYYMNNLKKYELNTSDIGGNYSKILYVNDSLLYAYKYANLTKSLNGGETWINVSKYVESALGTSNIFRDSRGTLFIATQGTGNLSMSMGNESNWTQVAPFICQNLSGEEFSYASEFNSFTETLDGSLLVGEYWLGNQSITNCSYIHKSTDGGSTWSMVYNGTSQFPETNPRHIHFVATDPYTGYIYATQGNNAPSSRLLRSVDNGDSWVSIQNVSGTAQSQYISVVFGNGYRIFGTDSSNNNLVKTTDDITFQTIYKTPAIADGYIWSLVKQDNGNIVGGIISRTADTYSLIIISPNDGDDWFTIPLRNESDTYLGVRSISQFDTKGYAIYYDNNLSLSQKFNIVQGDDYFSLVNLKLNENTGTTAYDVSGNGNNGTISGATWNNDGVSVALTENTHYNISSDIFKVADEDLSWTQIRLGYDYNYLGNTKSAINKTEFGLGTFADFWEIIVLAVVISVVIGLLLIVFAGKLGGRR